MRPCVSGGVSDHLKILSMETAFIEFLDGLYYPGYAVCFVDENPDAYYRQLAEFQNLYQSAKNLHMIIHLYLTVRIEVETALNLIECIREFENKTKVNVSDTPNVRVLEQEVFLSVLPNTKS